ncbi:MAG: DUF4445 domain-containing protein [Lachnospiraceae bacterium]|nr:DUF4445 domain-containing protein [Lachnospiraceae bacterium]
MSVVIFWDRGLAMENTFIYQENQKGIYVAVDIGTTSIGVSCFDVETKSQLASFSFSNPQKIYGADVITRIKNCLDTPSAEKNMSDMILIKLNESLKCYLGNNYNRISCLCYSGNTTMQHILRCLSVEGLSKAPFTPVSLDYFECEVSHEDNKAVINEAGNVRELFLPGFSAFVGADILAGVEYLGMGKSNRYDLLIDLGTNGELVLLNNQKGYATSTACGPVFDYGISGAVYGSECIKAIAMCIKRGLIDETGLIKEPFFEKGIDISDDITISQVQLRRFQMAKAAIYAGVISLIKKADIDYDDIENVYISGGLGFYLNIRDAFTVKMLPEQLKDKITVSGNTSLSGAERFLLSDDKDTILANYESIRSRTESFELADYERFEGIYIDSMNF